MHRFIRQVKPPASKSVMELSLARSPPVGPKGASLRCI